MTNKRMRGGEWAGRAERQTGALGRWEHSAHAGDVRQKLMTKRYQIDTYFVKPLPSMRTTMKVFGSSWSGCSKARTYPYLDAAHQPMACVEGWLAPSRRKRQCGTRTWSLPFRMTDRPQDGAGGWGLQVSRTASVGVTQHRSPAIRPVVQVW